MAEIFRCCRAEAFNEVMYIYAIYRPACTQAMGELTLLSLLRTLQTCFYLRDV